MRSNSSKKRFTSGETELKNRVPKELFEKKRDPFFHSQEFKAGQTIYEFLEKFPRLSDVWNFARVSASNLAERLVRVCPKLYKDLREFVGL